MSGQIQITPVTNWAEIEKMAASGSLHVINNTDQSNTRARGIIAMDVTGEDNQPFAIIIPDTWIPVDLAGYCAPVLFLKSNVFRRFITQKNLLVVNASTAKEMLNAPSYKEEQKRVNEFIAGKRNALNTAMGSGGVEDGTVVINTGSSMNFNVAVNSSEDNVVPDNNELHRLISQFNSGEINDEQAVEMLTTLSPDIGALKEVSGSVLNTGSALFGKIGDLISGMTPAATQGNYTGPKPPPGFPGS